MTQSRCRHTGRGSSGLAGATIPTRDRNHWSLLVGCRELWFSFRRLRSPVLPTVTDCVCGTDLPGSNVVCEVRHFQDCPSPVSSGRTGPWSFSDDTTRSPRRNRVPEVLDSVTGVKGKVEPTTLRTSLCTPGKCRSHVISGKNMFRVMTKVSKISGREQKESEGER